MSRTGTLLGLVLVLSAFGGASWTMDGNIVGTIVKGSGTIDPGGHLTGTIDTVAVGRFIQSLTNVSGVFGNGQYQQTQTTTFTDGASGTEFLTATRQ